MLDNGFVITDETMISIPAIEESSTRVQGLGPIPGEIAKTAWYLTLTINGDEIYLSYDSKLYLCIRKVPILPNFESLLSNSGMFPWEDIRSVHLGQL